MLENLTNTSFSINRSEPGFKEAYNGLCIDPNVQLEEDDGDVLFFSFFHEPQSYPLFALAWIINLPQLHMTVAQREFEHPALTALAYLGDSSHHYTEIMGDVNCYLFFTLNGCPSVFLRSPEAQDYIFSYSEACPKGEIALTDPDIIQEGTYLDPQEFFKHLPLDNNLYPLLDKWVKALSKRN